MNQPLDGLSSSAPARLRHHRHCLAEDDVEATIPAQFGAAARLVHRVLTPVSGRCR